MIKNFGGLLFSLLFNSVGLGGTTTNTLNLTSSTKTNTINTSTYIAELAGGRILYDGSNLSFADDILYSNGANKIIGPIFEKTVIDPVLTSFTMTTYVGPITIHVGPNQSQTFVLSPGQTDVDSLSTITYYNNSTYELIGVPEPASIILVGIGGLFILPWVILRRRP
jgi:hypothetical protein